MLQTKENKEKISQKIVPKLYQIHEKMVSDTILERFGHPPGAKIPQKRLQEQIFMKNEEFLGAPWALKWSKNQRKIYIKIVTIFLPM